MPVLRKALQTKIATISQMSYIAILNVFIHYCYLKGSWTVHDNTESWIVFFECSKITNDLDNTATDPCKATRCPFLKKGS